jgi:hypothetical protein
VTPTISVDSSIRSGSASVSVARTGNDYRFTFTLPSTNSGYDETFVCIRSGQITVLARESSSCSGTKYRMLLDQVSND